MRASFSLRLKMSAYLVSDFRFNLAIKYFVCIKIFLGSTKKYYLYDMRYFVLTIFLIYGQGISAQQVGRIETDRPDQTECPFIVKKGYFQGEIGFNRVSDKSGVNYLLPTSLLKVGIHPLVELRYTVLHQLGTSLATESFGFKSHLFKGDRFLPRTALIVQYHFNQDRRDQSELNPLPHSIGESIFTFQNNLGGPWGIGYNVGTEFHSDGTIEGIYRFAPNVNIGQNGYAYVELFGRFPQTKFTDTWVDGGLAYYVSDDIKADVSLGKSIQSSKSWYVALGISFRLRLW
jgi:hypothetical protein